MQDDTRIRWALVGAVLGILTLVGAAALVAIGRSVIRGACLAVTGASSVVLGVSNVREAQRRS